MTACAVLRTFIVLWLATLPLAFVEKMGWWTPGVCVLVPYAVLGELVGRDVTGPLRPHALLRAVPPDS